jgi:predicted nucleic acid-binding protein
MQEVILSDASCLILLEKIDQFDLLEKVFGEITITPEVEQEYGRTLPEWIKVSAVQNKMYQELLTVNVDAGAASVIALAVELENCLLIMDDWKGGEAARKLEIKFTGTLGVMLVAKEAGIISSLKKSNKQISAIQIIS